MRIGYTPPNDEDDNGHGHGNDAILQGGNGYYGNFISQGRDAYGNFRNPNGASTSHFREGPRDSNSTLTKNLLRNSNAANSTLTPGPNEPPPPYTVSICVHQVYLVAQRKLVFLHARFIKLKQ